MAKSILITSNSIGGRPDEELGRILMKNFLYALARNEERPGAILLMNEAVRLVCPDSSSLDDLRLLSESGVSIKVCGTCLDYFGLTAALAVGEIGTMPESVATLMAGDALTIG